MPKIRSFKRGDFSRENLINALRFTLRRKRGIDLKKESEGEEGFSSLWENILKYTDNEIIALSKFFAGFTFMRASLLGRSEVLYFANVSKNEDFVSTLRGIVVNALNMHTLTPSAKRLMLSSVIEGLNKRDAADFYRELLDEHVNLNRPRIRAKISLREFEKIVATTKDQGGTLKANAKAALKKKEIAQSTYDYAAMTHHQIHKTVDTIIKIANCMVSLDCSPASLPIAMHGSISRYRREKALPVQMVSAEIIIDLAELFNTDMNHLSKLLEERRSG